MTFTRRDGHLWVTLTARERGTLREAKRLVGKMRDEMETVNEDSHAGMGSALGYAERGLQDLIEDSKPLRLCEIEETP